MTNSQTESLGIAAVCDKHGLGTASMDAYLKNQAITAQWCALRDLDRLNGEVCEGRVNRVVFVRVEDLLDGIFNDEIKYAGWLAVGARVDFVESPGADASACLAVLGQSWEKYCLARRRRQTVAGLILGSIAIAAAFVVAQF